MTPTVAREIYLIFLLVLLENIYVKGFGGRTFTDHELEQQLKILNKPYVKSFKIGNNDIDTFDCVDIYQQPALTHPLLKGHKIQMSPSDVPTMDHDKSVRKGEDVDFGNLTQTCPTGTVPIRRMRKEDLIMGQILMKNLTENYEYKYHFSVAASQDAVPYYGAYAEINIQSPTVAERTQFSEALMRIQSTKVDESNFVQAGWTVCEALYNDTQPRLSTSWGISRGAKAKGGCFNTQCPGFVQVHQSIAPGFPLTSSTYGGDQKEAIYLIYKSHTDGNWWLTFGEKNEQIGYWPNALFTTLQGSGDHVYWGGQVFSRTDIPSPPMGNGHFAEEGFKKAAYLNNLLFLDAELNRHHVVQWDQLAHIVSTPKCYTLAPCGSNGIFYGGPGGNCST